MILFSRYKGYDIGRANSIFYLLIEPTKEYKSLVAVKQAIGRMANLEDKPHDIMMWNCKYSPEIISLCAWWSIDFLSDKGEKITLATADDITMKKFNGFLKSKGLDYFHPISIEAPL